MRFELRNREATQEERAYLDGLGAVAVSTGLRSMARLADGSEQTLTEVKAIDGSYPLFGTFVTEPNRPLSELLAGTGDTYGAIAAPLLLERLGIKVGDEILLGNVKLKLTGTVVDEPDALSDGFGFAPRLMVSRDALCLWPRSDRKPGGTRLQDQAERPGGAGNHDRRGQQGLS